MTQNDDAEDFHDELSALKVYRKNDKIRYFSILIRLLIKLNDGN